MHNQFKHPISGGVIVAMAILLTACGGGGGGASSGGGGTPTSLATEFGAGSAPATDKAATAIQGAAAAVPTEGSVTQSSRTASDGVTQDEVSAEYDANNNVTITNNATAASWNGITEGDADVQTLANRRHRIGTRAGASGDLSGQQKLLQRTLANGDRVLVEVFTDRTAVGADYLVGGIWALIPANTDTGDFEIGAFGDAQGYGKTPPDYVTAASGTADFSGGASGMYYMNDPTTPTVSGFVADVALTLNYGATPGISGMLDNFYQIALGDTQTNDSLGAFELTLSSTSVATGFWTGDTIGSGSFGGGVARNYTGKWGGQLYGATADKAIGTFGGHTAATSGTAADDITFVGVFEATKTP